MFVLGSVSLLFPHWNGLLAYSIKYVRVSVSVCLSDLFALLCLQKSSKSLWWSIKAGSWESNWLEKGMSETGVLFLFFCKCPALYFRESNVVRVFVCGGVFWVGGVVGKSIGETSIFFLFVNIWWKIWQGRVFLLFFGGGGGGRGLTMMPKWLERGMWETSIFLFCKCPALNFGETDRFFLWCRMLAVKCQEKLTGFFFDVEC